MSDGFQHQYVADQRRWDDADGPAVTIRTMVLEHDHRLDAIEDWRSELKGAMTLVKFTLGASILSGLLAAIALADLLLRARLA